MWWFLLACGGTTTQDSSTSTDSASVVTDSAVTATDSGTTASDSGEVDTDTGLARADVVEVSASGDEGSWTFLVSMLSDDVGCDHYADWWEVVDQDGELLYRRTLRHSHVDEQPFARDGGPVAVAGDQLVWVRGHQNDRGYGGVAMSGSVDAGFAVAEWPAGLGEGLEDQEPQPDPCLY